MRIFEYRNELKSQRSNSHVTPKTKFAKLKGSRKSHQKPLNVALSFMPWLCIGFNQIKREFVYGAASLQLVNVKFTLQRYYELLQVTIAL